MFSKLAYDIFWESILRYHIADDVNQPFEIRMIARLSNIYCIAKIG